MHKRYFILHGNIFSQRDWERFGCDFFLQRGYDVIPVELVELLSPGTYSQMTKGTFTSRQNVVRINTEQEMDELVTHFGPADFVLMAFYLNAKSAFVFRILTKYKIDYMSLTIGGIPTNDFRNFRSALNLKEYLKFKYMTVKTKAYLLKRYVWTMFADGVGWVFLRPPRWWMRAGRYHNALSAVAPKPWKAELISVRSFDMQVIDAVQNQNKKEGEIFEKPYAVLIDDDFLDHPDFIYMGINRPVTKERFSCAMQSFIAKLEKDLRLRVVVAGHPKALPENASIVYGAYPFIQDRTAELVAHSELVVVCCSTALSFAVRLRKPVIVITTDEIERNRFYGGFVANMSSWLGLRRTNIDRLKAHDSLVMPVVDQRCYESYEQNFLAEKGVGSHSIWEEAARHFEAHISKRASDSIKRRKNPELKIEK